jgi:hypothetical protein
MANLPQTQFSVLPTRPEDNENGLAARLTFEGGSLVDSSGSQNNAAVTGSPTVTSGPFGQSALSINGGSAYPKIPYTAPNFGALVQSAAAGTWAIWFKTSTTGNVVIMSAASPVSSASGIVVYCQAGTFAGVIKGGGTQVAIASNSGAPQNGNWHHGVLTWDYPNNACVAYLDGVASSVGTFSNSFSFASFENLNIGHASDSFWTAMVGSVADFRGYSRALTAAEVFALYRSSISFPSAPSEGDMAALTGSLTVNASGSQTLGGVIQGGVAALVINASAAQTLGNVTQTATAALVVKASGSTTLDNITQAATGSLVVSASGAQTLDGITQSAAATVDAASISASGDQALDDITQSATASVPVSASGSAVLDNITQSGAVTVPDGAQGAEPLDNVVQLAAAESIINASGAVTLDGVSQSSAATVIIGAVGVQALGDVVQVATAKILILKRVIELVGTVSRSVNLGGAITRSIPASGSISRVLSVSGSIPRRENQG